MLKLELTSHRNQNKSSLLLQLRCSKYKHRGKYIVTHSPIFMVTTPTQSTCTTSLQGKLHRRVKGERINNERINNNGSLVVTSDFEMNFWVVFTAFVSDMLAFFRYSDALFRDCACTHQHLTVIVSVMGNILSQSF